jgi:hypothetical protein
MANWHTPATVAVFWRSAPADTTVTSAYLEVAKQSCLDYAPLPAGIGADNIPENYRLAQAMQARNLYNAGLASPRSGDFDGSEYGAAVFPLDWTVQQILLPVIAFGGVA